MPYNRPRMAQVASDGGGWCMDMAKGCKGLFCGITRGGKSDLTDSVGV